jgi:hypothetical protein
MNKEKIQTLLAEYGKIAVYTYLVLFALVLAGFALAIGTGLKVDGSAGTLGVLGAAYVATKLTQPIRIAASLALTPIVARLFDIKKKQLTPSDEPTPSDG